MEGFFKSQEADIKRAKIEGKVISFDDPEMGKSTPIRIVKVNEVLGNGSYSRWVANVSIELADDEGPEKKRMDMAIKKYANWLSNPKEDVLASYKNYKTVKKAGIPTWNTYRINLKNQMVLMTLGKKEKEILIATNDDEEHTKQLFKENPVKYIENFDEFIKEIDDLLRKAIQNKISFRPDSYGIVFSPSDDNLGSYKIHILITDLDSVDHFRDDHYERHPFDSRTEYNQDAHNLECALFNIFPGTRQEKRAFERKVASQLKILANEDR